MPTALFFISLKKLNTYPSTLRYAFNFIFILPEAEFARKDEADDNIYYMVDTIYCVFCL